VRAKLRQQLQVLRDEGDVEFVDDQGTYRIRDGSEVKEAKTTIERKLADEPQPTSESEEFVTTTRRSRDRAFRDVVREAYQQTCAFCGNSCETPAGMPEVEAAHIYPKAEGGPDDLRNGIALCKLHHWAFDSGWISVTDDCELLVADTPKKNGYQEFKRLAGQRIRLPADDDRHPHPSSRETPPTPWVRRVTVVGNASNCIRPCRFDTRRSSSWNSDAPPEGGYGCFEYYFSDLVDISRK